MRQGGRRISVINYDRLQASTVDAFHVAKCKSHLQEACHTALNYSSAPSTERGVQPHFFGIVSIIALGS